MTFTITYRVNIGRYEPLTATITGCSEVDWAGQWVGFIRNGKQWRIPICNIVCIIEE
jgi:hypothetical protein